jgi:hypothetical protein
MRTLLLFLSLIVVFSCTPYEEKSEPEEHPSGFAMTDMTYAEITEASIKNLAAFDFETWGTQLADDIEYHFPDGDQNSRTKLIGKEAVLNWWKDWEANSGVTSMTMGDLVVIPVSSSSKVSSTGLAGNYGLAWVTTRLGFDNGNTVSFRMNMDLHFNEENKIDRIFSYYDRTGLIQAMGGNILSPETTE